VLKPALRYRWLATLAWAVLSLVTSSLAFASISHRTASPFPDRAEHAAQYNATGNQRDHHFTGNPTPAGRVGARDVGKAAAVRRWVGASPHLGMPKELIDGEGHLAWAAAHSAYGAVIATQGPDDVAVDGGFVQSNGPRVESPFRLLGQVNDEDAELAWTRFRCFDADTGTWISTDPFEIAGGLALYGFDGSPSDVVDPLGLMARKNHGKKVYRQLSAEDRERFDRGEPIQPKGTGGRIADHIKGESTGHISASETAGATKRFDSGNGLVEIDVAKAEAGGANFIDHNNVMQAARRSGDSKTVRDAKRAEEVLFGAPIPADAMKLI
jgi:RHS repeat-associated protein